MFAISCLSFQIVIALICKRKWAIFFSTWINSTQLSSKNTADDYYTEHLIIVYQIIFQRHAGIPFADKQLRIHPCLFTFASLRCIWILTVFFSWASYDRSIVCFLWTHWVLIELEVYWNLCEYFGSWTNAALLAQVRKLIHYASVVVFDTNIVHHGIQLNCNSLLLLMRRHAKWCNHVINTIM